MNEFLTVLAIIAYVALPVWTLVWLVRRVRATMRSGKGLGFEKIVDPHAPEPVVPCGAVRRTAWAIVVFSALHLLGVTAWLITQYAVPLTIRSGVVAIYVIFGATVTIVGAAMLNRARAYGRTVAVWGLFLLGMIAFMGAVGMLMVTRYDEAPRDVRRVALWMALVLAGHMFLSGYLGRAARLVGRPSETSGGNDGT